MYSEASDFRTLSVRPILAWTAYAVGVSAYAFLFSLWQTEAVPAAACGAGVLLAAVCALPIAFWAARGGRNLPMFELICLSYLLAYSVPLYLQPNGVIIKSRLYRLEWDTTTHAVFLATGGVAAMIVAYYGLYFHRLARIIPRIDLPLTQKGWDLYPLISILVGVATMGLQAIQLSTESTSGLTAFLRLLAGQFYIGVALMGYRAYGNAPRAGRWRLILYGSVVVGALLGLCTGMVENAVLPVLILFVVRWHATGRFPVLWLAAGVPLFLILTTSKYEYRQAVWDRNQSTSIAGKISAWLDAASRHLTPLADEGGGSEMQAAVDKTVHRLDLIHVFSYVTQYSPDQVPFYGGATYAYLFYGLVPRILWPDKPIAAANDQLAIDFRLIDRRYDQTTSIGVGHVAEAYANFGPLGIVIILAIEGLAFALVAKVLDGPESEGGRAIYLAVLVLFLNGIGATTASLFMGAFWGIVANAFILRFVASGWRAVETRPLAHSTVLPGRLARG